MATFGGVIVKARNGAVSVNLTQPSGATPTVYADGQGTTLVALPCTVAAGTSQAFYVNAPTALTLSVQYEGQEYADPINGSTLTLGLGPGEVQRMEYDTRLFPGAGGASTSVANTWTADQTFTGKAIVKSDGVVDVRAYGCDVAATDNATALQAAIDANPGRVILLPPGGLLKVASSVNVTAEGTTIRGWGWRNAVSGLAPTGTVPALVVQAKYCNFENFEVDGTNQGAGGVANVVFQNARQSRVCHVYSHNSKGDGFRFDLDYLGLTHGNNNILMLDHCYASSNAGHGFGMPTHSTDNNGIMFLGCEGSSNTLSGALIKASGVKFFGGIYMGNSRYGVELGEAADTSTTTGVHFYYPWFEANTLQAGVYASSQASGCMLYATAGQQSVISADNIARVNQHWVDSNGAWYFGGSHSVSGATTDQHERALKVYPRTGSVARVEVTPASQDAADTNMALYLDGKGTRGVMLGMTTGSYVGFYGTIPVVKPTVSGAKGGNAALASLLTALAGLGLLTDSTTA